MRAVVTGGAGFIGSHLCERLLREGHEVIVIDDLNDFYSPAEKASNLSSVARVGAVSIYREDICNSDAINEVFQCHVPEAVIHLAGRAGVRPSLTAPLLYERVNVQGTINVLEACKNLHRRPRFILASSSSVYGIESRAPFREQDCSHRPISPYAATKLAAEEISFTYSYLYGIPAVCLRFFTVYGPRQRPDLAIRKFIEAVQDGRTLQIFGDGAAARDYTFVDDIVSGIVKALDCDSAFEILNLGNSRPIRTCEVVAAIENALKRKAQCAYLPAQPGDVPLTCADISRAHRLLGYEPRTRFEDGIRCAAAWCETKGAAAAAVSSRS